MTRLTNLATASPATRTAYIEKVRQAGKTSLTLDRSLVGQRAHIEDMHIAFRFEVLEAWKQPGANAAAVVYSFGA